MFTYDIDLADVITFVTQVTVVLFFSGFLMGFTIKKMMQLMMR